MFDKCSSVGQGKKLSPRLESVNPWLPRHWLGSLSTELRETLGEQLGHRLICELKVYHLSLFITQNIFYHIEIRVIQCHSFHLVD